MEDIRSEAKDVGGQNPQKGTLCWPKGWDFREPLNGFKL